MNSNNEQVSELNQSPKITVYCTRPKSQSRMDVGVSHPHTNKFLEVDILDKSKRRELKCKCCGMPLALGTEAQYVPIDVLGTGGFGVTFLAINFKVPGRTISSKPILDLPRVAIKQLKDDHLDAEFTAQERQRKDRILDRFDKEARTLFSLKHQRIPALIDWFEEPSLPDTRDRNFDHNQAFQSIEQPVLLYLVQDYIEGVDLSRAIKNEKSFAEEDVERFLREILKILEDVHSGRVHKKGTPVIHRDIKPSNIICSVKEVEGDGDLVRGATDLAQGTLYLIDFGAVKEVIKLTDENVPPQSITRTKIASGCFTSPEQQYNGLVSPCSDLYSLAVTCISLLTGKENPYEFVSQNLTQQSWIGKFNVSQGFATILGTMLAFDPLNRYQSASEVLSVLDKLGEEREKIKQEEQEVEEREKKIRKEHDRIERDEREIQEERRRLEEAERRIQEERQRLEEAERRIQEEKQLVQGEVARIEVEKQEIEKRKRKIRRKEKTRMIWGVGGIGLVAMLIIGELWQTWQSSQLKPQDFSRGEDRLFPQQDDWYQNNAETPLDCKSAFQLKKAGQDAIKEALALPIDQRKESLEKAREKLKEALEKMASSRGSGDAALGTSCPYDPETLIALANVQAWLSGNPIDTLAVVVPLDENDQNLIDASKAILAGVAIQQAKINGIEIDESDKLVINDPPLRPVQIVIASDGGKVGKAEKVAQALSEQRDGAFVSGDPKFDGQILGVIGHSSSATTSPAGAKYEDYQIPLVSPTSTAVRSSKLSFTDNVFRLSPSDAIAGRDLGKYAKEELKAEKVYVISSQDGPYSDSYINVIEGEFGGLSEDYQCYLNQFNLIQFESPKCGSQDIPEDVDVVIIVPESEDVKSALESIKNLRKNRPSLSILGGDTLYRGSFIAEDDRALTGLVITIPWHVDRLSKDSPYQRMLVRFLGTNSIDWRTGTAFDSALILTEALTGQTQPTRQGTLEFLNKLKTAFTEGITGSIQFCKSGDRMASTGVGVLAEIVSKQNGSESNGKTSLEYIAPDRLLPKWADREKCP